MAREDRVRRITDQQQLYEIAISHENMDFRISAIETIANQLLLKKILFEVQELEVQNAILKRIDDQSVLCTFALDTDRDALLRVQAVEKLENKKALKKLLFSENQYIRRSAILKIQDQSILTRIMTESEDHILRKRAVERSFDKETLRAIVAEDDSPLVIDAALKRLRAISKLDIHENKHENIIMSRKTSHSSA